MRYVLIIVLFLAAVASPVPASAKPLKGFNEGPYLCLEGGIVQANFDRDQQTGAKIGHDFEPAVGLIFGWNIWDWFSAEIEGNYGTNTTSGRREHLVGAKAYGKYFFIMDDWTDFKSLRIMPTIKGGISFRVASLPGNQSSADTAVTTFGWGPSFGGGISFLLKKYLFFGVEVQGDLLFFDDIRQNLTISGQAAPNTLVYNGGFYPQLSAIGFIGVHY